MLVGLAIGGYALLLSGESAFVGSFEHALSADLRAGPGRDTAKVRVALQPLFMIPGNSGARVALLDEDDDEIRAHQFSTGWRIDCESAEIARYPGSESLDLLVINCRPAINGRGVLRQYYGVTPDDRLTLVRLETTDGAFGGLNTYAWPNHTIGPLPQSRTCMEWKTALNSEDPVAVLEALMWVGGYHSGDRDRDDHVSLQTKASAHEAVMVRTDLGVLDSVRALSRSTDPWIARAAIETLISVGYSQLQQRESKWEAEIEDRDWKGAVGTLTSAIASFDGLDPQGYRTRSDLAGAYQTRGRCHFRLGSLVEAEADYSEAIELAESPSWSLGQRGRVRLLLGKRGQGLTDLRKAAELRPSDPYSPLWIAALTGEKPANVHIEEAWLQHVHAFLSGKSTEAELLHRVGRISERQCVAHCFLGIRAELAGDWEKALGHYRRSVETDAHKWRQYDWAQLRLDQGVRADSPILSERSEAR